MSGATGWLTHGAWADGSNWAKIIAPLAADGTKVAAAPPLPLTSFRDDVAALDRTLERVTGPVVPAGHAYAGAVIVALLLASDQSSWLTGDRLGIAVAETAYAAYRDLRDSDRWQRLERGAGVHQSPLRYRIDRVRRCQSGDIAGIGGAMMPATYSSTTCACSCVRARHNTTPRSPGTSWAR